MVSGVWCLMSGVWFLDSGVWCVVLGILVFGAWLLVSGGWCSVFGSWLLVLGAYRWCKMCSSMFCCFAVFLLRSLQLFLRFGLVGVLVCQYVHFCGFLGVLSGVSLCFLGLLVCGISSSTRVYFSFLSGPTWPKAVLQQVPRRAPTGARPLPNPA